MMKRICLLGFFLTLVACAEDGMFEPNDDSTVNVTVDSERADRTSEIRLRANGLTVWMRPDVNDVEFPTTGWTLQGRASRNLNSVTGFVGIAAIDVEQLSARKFRINLPADALEPALIGDLFVQVETSAGVHTLRVALQAQFVRGEGSSYLYPYRNIDLIAVDGVPMFRGTVSTRRNFEWVEGWNDDDSEPISTKVSPRKFTLDFEPGRLTWAAHPFQDALMINGLGENGRRYRRDANIRMAIDELGLTDGNPRIVWPVAECDPQGAAREQIACGPN